MSLVSDGVMVALLNFSGFFMKKFMLTIGIALVIIGIMTRMYSTYYYHSYHKNYYTKERALQYEEQRSNYHFLRNLGGLSIGVGGVIIFIILRKSKKK
jgi:hypothetical protein